MTTLNDDDLAGRISYILLKYRNNVFLGDFESRSCYLIPTTLFHAQKGTPIYKQNVQISIILKYIQYIQNLNQPNPLNPFGLTAYHDELYYLNRAFHILNKDS